MKENILGVDVSNVTYETLVKQVFGDMDGDKQSFIVAVNPEKIMIAREDPALMALINGADYQIPDGVGLLIASKLRKGAIKHRVTGVDLMMRLVEEAEQQAKSVFLFGGEPGVADVAKEKLRETYPALKVAGTLDGYIEDNDLIIQTINESQADILFVAMGSPKQEEWIRDHKDHLHVSVFQGVGGSFDVISGTVKRAPKFFQKLGIEWLYRLMSEPKRWRRQLALPQFLIKVLRQKNRGT